MELKIEGAQGLVLWLGPNDLVQVPLNPSDRVMCRQALLDALTLLDQTESVRTISTPLRIKPTLA